MKIRKLTDNEKKKIVKQWYKDKGKTECMCDDCLETLASIIIAYQYKYCHEK